MKRLILADCHIGQREHDADVMCLLLEAAQRQDVGEILYLGDSFQYLVGMEKFWTAGIKAVIGGWDRYRAQGGRIVVIEGNRDFFLDAAEFRPHVDEATMVHSFSAGELRYRLVHGDRVNQEDLQYLFWARISKSGVARFFARLLPRVLAVWIVSSMEQRLAKSNKKYRYRKPIDDLQREAEKAWSEDVDVLLWGHFHSHWQHRCGDHLAMVVPAWLENRVGLLVDDDGGWQIVDVDLQQVDMPIADDDASGGGQGR